MAATEGADPPRLDDFEPDFPPGAGNDPIASRSEDEAPDDSLAAAFDDWDSSSRDAPSMQMVNLLTELLSLVEAWRTEGVTSNKQLEARVIGELKGVQTDLETIRASDTESQQSYKQALRSLWQQTQELSTGVQDLAAGTNQDDASELILTELGVLKERIAEVSINVQRQEQVVAGQLTALESQVQSAEARAEQLARQTDLIHVRLNEGLEILEAKETAASDSQEILQTRIARVLEAFDERMAGRHEQTIDGLQDLLRALGLTVAGAKEGVDGSLALGLAAVARAQQDLEAKVLQAMQAVAEAHQGTEAKLAQGLEAVVEGQKAAETSLAERLDAVEAGRKAFETNLSEKLGTLAEEQKGIEAALVQKLDAAAEAQQAGEGRVAEGLKVVAQGLKGVAEAQSGSEAKVLKGLEAIESRTAERHQEAGGRAEQLAEDLKKGFASLDPARAEIKSGFAALSQAVGELRKELAGSGERHQSDLLERLGTMEAEVTKSLSGGTEEREQLRQAISLVSVALKQVRAEVKEETNQSETRLRRQLESVETQTLQAIAEVCASLLNEQRSTKLDLETRIDRGVREPLKTTVTLLNRQLNEIEATVDRTFDALRNADLTIRIDSMDALIESRMRSRKPDGVVVLPSGVEAPAVKQEEETKS